MEAMNYKIYCHQNKLQIQSFSTTLSIFTFEINYRMETRNLKMPLVDWNWSYPPYFSSLFLLISPPYSSLFLLLGLLVQQLVQVVEARLVGAVDVVPANIPTMSNWLRQNDPSNPSQHHDSENNVLHVPPVADEVLLVEN